MLEGPVNPGRYAMGMHEAYLTGCQDWVCARVTHVIGFMEVAALHLQLTITTQSNLLACPIILL